VRCHRDWPVCHYVGSGNRTHPARVQLHMLLVLGLIGLAGWVVAVIEGMPLALAFPASTAIAIMLGAGLRRMRADDLPRENPDEPELKPLPHDDDYTKYLPM
jgi:hypothetical protein